VGASGCTRPSCGPSRLALISDRAWTELSDAVEKWKYAVLAALESAGSTTLFPVVGEQPRQAEDSPPAVSPSPQDVQIESKLARLLAWQTNFLKKINPTAAERQEYAKTRDRVRELFDELEQLAKAA
jgi:uncharacterized coiled-coil protein SlyX